VADYSPVYTGGAQPFTITTSAAVTGGQVLETTTTNAAAAAGALSLKFIGVAAHDAASGAKVSVWPIPGVIHETVNGNAGTITVGASIVPGAAGTADTAATGVSAAAGYLMGTAVTTAATTAKIRWIGR
jgi:Uncharacterized conserved protein (DUF2190)